MDPRDKRPLLRFCHILREAALGQQPWAWFEDVSSETGKVRADTAQALLRMGSIEKVGDVADRPSPRTYRATEAGRKFLKDNDLEASDWIERVEKVRLPEHDHD